MRERRRRKSSPPSRDPVTPKKRLRQRKTALALTAGAMSLTTGAQGYRQAEDANFQQAIEVRKPAVLLHASDDLKEALIQAEGVRTTVYRDVAGYPTVGVGHLVRPKDRLQVGDQVSREKILDFLDSDLEHAEEAVTRLAGDLPLLQHEFDALVDLVFNVGEGNVSEDESPLLNQAIARGDYRAIAAELDYHHAGGRKVRGLVHRSERRANIFLDASYEDPRQSV